MKKTNFIMQKPIDKSSFKKALADTNSKRTLPAMIVLMIFTGMMFFAQISSKYNSPDPLIRERSETVVYYAYACFIPALIATILYFFSLRKKSSDSFRYAMAYVFFVMHILLGSTTGLLMFLLDGESILTFHALFTLFVCLILLFRPILSIFTLALISLLTIMAYSYLPDIMGFEVDPFVQSVALETTLVIFVLSSIISVVMYQNFVNDFNKSYTINQLNEELSWRIKIDPLTEIFNRKEFATQLSDSAKQATENNSWLSVAIYDIDYFKQYNDTYGHLEGDKCLQDIAKTLEKSAFTSSPNASVARYGGEEFTILVPDLSPEEAQKLFEKAREDIQNLNIEHSTSKVNPVVTVSAGAYSLKPKEGYNIQKALAAADDLLYKAKENGRNKIISEIQIEE